MYRFLVVSVMALAVVLTAAGSSEAITRVERTWSFIEFYGGSGTSVGSYDAVAEVPFILENNRPVSLDAGDVFKEPIVFGFNYGQLRNEHFQISFGFRYTGHKLLDTIVLAETDELVEFLIPHPKLSVRQYDLNLDANYHFMNLEQSLFSPFAGLGVRTGLTSSRVEGFDSENELNLALALNFGGEVRLYSAASGTSFVSLASVNSWEFVGTGDRPKYLNFGGAIKYYFRI